MLRVVLGRTVSGLVTLLLAITIAFFLARGTGSPAEQILGDGATPQQIADLERHLGLDRPLLVQYVDYLGHLVTFDLGDSLRYHASNLDLITSRMPASFTLALVAMLIAVVVGIPLGILAARHEGGLIDRIASGGALLGQSMPLFWLGLMLILIFSVELGWLPAGQFNSPSSVILPALTLSTLPTAQIARLTRSSMGEVLGAGFITAAEARGIARWRITLVHAFRSASLPVVTVVGLQAGMLLSGAVTVEYVFGWPGLGTLALQAVQARDFTLVQGIVVVGATIFVLINLAVDVLYGLVDPRIREGASA
ncbi:MAG TPA: ABC transporter permease [Nocardioides sp.]|jgi:peptide/nickel transport system permease protein|uniref:ABC transporter permease n=1 Tax=Nocardioides sp. TaxID=35761 RepID=UPI002C57AAA8|nr:ABC transporter permease [Nocardioides sp.]HTW15826.1 ABC transporter permease [Nocardioides sp.]